MVRTVSDLTRRAELFKGDVFVKSRCVSAYFASYKRFILACPAIFMYLRANLLGLHVSSQSTNTA